MAIPSRTPDQNAPCHLPAIATASNPSHTEGQAVMLSVDADGNLRTTATLSGGGDATLAEQQTQTTKLTSIDGKLTSGVAVTGTFWQATQPVSLASVPSHAVTNAGTFAVQPGPTTSGGLSISRVLSAATTNATSAKGSAGQVYGWYISNSNASARYLKLYNKASAPTVGTDTPVMTVYIPGGAAANVGFTHGIAFGTGIAYALTTGATDADTGAVAANELIVNLFFK